MLNGFSLKLFRSQIMKVAWMEIEGSKHAEILNSKRNALH
jgi:hypothetical protein